MRVGDSVILVLSAFTCALAHRNGGLVARRVLESRGASEEGEGNPIKRVVQLLGKMKNELQAEADNESAMYDKMVCWCETNEKEKTKAIADAEAKDEQLVAEIASRGANFGELTTEVARLKKQIAEDTESLKSATAIREKAASEFRAEEKDTVQAIDNLRNAIAVLSRHHGGSLLQLDAPLVSSMRVLLRNLALKYDMLVAGEPQGRVRQGAGLLQTALRGLASEQDKDTKSLQEALLTALDTKSGTESNLPVEFAEGLVARAAQSALRVGVFVQSSMAQPKDAAYKSYSARSGQIFGVLNTMLEEFNAQLSTAQKDESRDSKAYEELAAAKTEQIEVAKQKLDDLEGDNAANSKALSDAKEDLAMTRNQRTADVDFLRNLKVTCDGLDKEWERRSATRSAELTAVAETIAILTEDDNREMLAKSVSLLQFRTVAAGSTSLAARRSRTVEALRRSAQAPAFDADELLAAWHSRGVPSVGAAAGPRAQLSTLAVSVQLDSFTKVKEMMDTMVAELKEQQVEEVKFKAYCTKEFDENEKATFKKETEKKDLESKAESLAASIERLKREIADEKNQISATETEVKKASQIRESENAEFQQTVSDQRATQDILKKAVLRLKDFYDKDIGKKVIYLQTVRQTPPVQFNKYEANSGSSPVMGLLESIIADSKALESEATSSEYKAQAEYETFVKDSTNLIGTLSDSVTSKTKQQAAAKLDAAETDGDIKSTEGELESLAAYNGDLHSECDFVLKNFDIRQKARLQEMEAIQAAKMVLSGAEGSR